MDTVDVVRELVPWGVFVVVAGTALVVLWRLVMSPGPVANRPSLAEATLGYRPMFGDGTAALAGMFPTSADQSLDRDLARAGFYRPTAREEFVAIRNLLVAGTTLAVAAWGVVLADDPQFPSPRMVLTGLGAVACAYALPRSFVRMRAERRAERIMTGLPDALDMLFMALSGGLPLQSALERVTVSLARTHPDLAAELEIVRRQTVAYSLDHALRRMAERIDDESLTALTTLTSHAERLGADVSAVLVEYADQMRATRMQKAEETGNSRSIQLVFPVTLCLAPACFILILGPAFLNLGQFRDRLGKDKPAAVQGATETPGSAAPRATQTGR